MKPEIKKLLILNLPYLLFVWLFDKVGAAVRLSPGADASAKLLHLGDGFTAAFSSIAPSFHPADLALGIAGAVIVRLIIYTKGKNAKKYRRGTEYGSARWGGADDIKPYTDPVFENNIPLTQTERLTMNSRPKQPKYARNKNILVIGGSGSGKTRFFVKPSLMQCTSKDFPTSYIVTDPKGTLILETGKMLQRYKYRIKVLNTINFKKSMKYNPFAYLRSEKDILKLVNTIIANTKGDGEKSGEDFWVKAEKLYYTALIGYIWYEAPEDEKNFTTLLEMINASEAREDDEDFQNPVDLMFERLEEKDPEHFAVKQYRKYKLAAGKTAKSILISCGARLAPFDIKELRVYDLYPAAAEKFKEDMKDAVKGDIIVCSDPKDASIGDVVVGFTQSKDKYIKDEWIKPGQIVFPMGSYTECEDALLLNADKIIVDHVGQCMHRGALHDVVADGKLKEEDIYATIGDVAVGRKPTDAANERIICVPIGTGAMDIAVAGIVYKRALEKGLGGTFEFL